MSENLCNTVSMEYYGLCQLKNNKTNNLQKWKHDVIIFKNTVQLRPQRQRYNTWGDSDTLLNL